MKHIILHKETEPLKRRLSHRHHEKRGEPEIVTVTTIDSAHYETEEVIVYVDANKKPVSTTTVKRQVSASSQTPAPSPPQAAPPASSSSSSAPVQAPVAVNKLAAKPINSKPPPATSTPSSPPPPASSSSAAAPAPAGPDGAGGSGGSASSGPGFGSAITYTPYNCDRSCKSTQQVARDLEKASSYQVIRLYGTDCNQVANVIAATKGNVKLFLGIFKIDSVESEVKAIASAVNGNWGIVNTVSVGNELVNNGGASPAQVIAAIGAARSALKAAGYSGPVVTVDTMVAMKAHPELCKASDFCAINCHAFFDGNTLPAGAGDFVKGWAKQVSDAAGGKQVVITESGWPHTGSVSFFQPTLPVLSRKLEHQDMPREHHPSNLHLRQAFTNRR